MPDRGLLVQTLVQLADNLVEDFDVVDLLTLLSDRCTQVLDVAAAGVMLATPRGDLQVVASSSEAMRLLELFELQADQGPCVDCYRTARPVVNKELDESDGRWPRFARRAADQGFRSAHALPLRLRGRCIGALNLFRAATGSLGPDEVVAAQALADVATIAIVQHQASVDATVINGRLTAALHSRVVIEQAKGKVSEAARVDVDQAFWQLRNHARNHHLRLAELCAAIADGTIRPAVLDRPDPATPRK